MITVIVSILYTDSLQQFPAIVHADATVNVTPSAPRRPGGSCQPGQPARRGRAGAARQQRIQRPYSTYLWVIPGTSRRMDTHAPYRRGIGADQRPRHAQSTCVLSPSRRAHALRHLKNLALPQACSASALASMRPRPVQPRRVSSVRSASAISRCSTSPSS